MSLDTFENPDSAIVEVVPDMPMNLSPELEGMDFNEILEKLGTIGNYEWVFKFWSHLQADPKYREILDTEPIIVTRKDIELWTLSGNVEKFRHPIMELLCPVIDAYSLGMDQQGRNLITRTVMTAFVTLLSNNREITIEEPERVLFNPRPREDIEA